MLLECFTVNYVTDLCEICGAEFGLVDAQSVVI